MAISIDLPCDDGGITFILGSAHVTDPSTAMCLLDESVIAVSGSECVWDNCLWSPVLSRTGKCKELPSELGRTASYASSSIHSSEI